jgi:hypothetical protein
MSKYIDADKLKAEIEMRIAQWQSYTFACASQIASEAFDRIDELKGLLIYITSLQQEQPEPSCKTCGFYENNCPFIRGKFIPYPNKVCKDYTYSVMKEQPEADLEKIIGQTYHDGSVADTSNMDHMDYENIARYFYALGLNARKEE